MMTTIVPVGTILIFGVDCMKRVILCAVVSVLSLFCLVFFVACEDAGSYGDTSGANSQSYTQSVDGSVDAESYVGSESVGEPSVEGDSSDVSDESSAEQSQSVSRQPFVPISDAGGYDAGDY